MLKTENRLRTAADFRAVLRRGSRFRKSTVVLHVLRTDPESPTRIGFIVSKSVGGAVTRNWVRRHFRETIRRRLDDIPSGTHIVARALPDAGQASRRQVDADVNHALTRALSAKWQR